MHMKPKNKWAHRNIWTFKYPTCSATVMWMPLFSHKSHLECRWVILYFLTVFCIKSDTPDITSEVPVVSLEWPEVCNFSELSWYSVPTYRTLRHYLIKIICLLPLVETWQFGGFSHFPLGIPIFFCKARADDVYKDHISHPASQFYWRCCMMWVYLLTYCFLSPIPTMHCDASMTTVHKARYLQVHFKAEIKA